MGTPQDIEQLEDVSNSEAYKILDTLADDMLISHDKADAAKSRFKKLHSALVAAMTREKEYLSETKSLNRKCEEDKRAYNAGTDGGVEASIDSLREDVEAAMAEAALAQERQQLMQLEVTDLQRQRNDLSKQAREMAEEHAAALAPMLESLQNEVEELQGDVVTETGRVESTRQELEACRGRITQLLLDIDNLSASKNQERQALLKVDQLPDKARRQTEAVAGALKNIQGQMETANQRLQEAENGLKTIRAKQQEHEEEHARLLTAQDRGRVQVEAKERHADDVRKDVELASIEADKILADQVELDLKIKSAAASVKAEHEALQRRIREKELMLRQCKVAQGSLEEVRDSLPNMRFQVEQLQRDQASMDAKLKTQSRGMEEVKRDLDISMNDFLKEEAIGKDKAGMFAMTAKQVSVMEAELAELRKEEGERAKILLDLGSQRDRVALSIAQKLAKVKDVQLAARIKEVELAELKKIKRETLRRIRDYEKLYDLVKNQRNKFVNLIQAANQSTTEMKDKSKILTNELDILHNEVHMKDKLLVQSRSQHQSAVAERDSLRIELGKLGSAFRGKQDAVDEQIAEVDKLNAIINLTEKEMLKLRKQYEVVIEARNYTGIMLIDRNDELCILYEKHNIQDQVLKAGVLEMNRRDDEARVLKLAAQDLQRSIAVTVKMVPQVPALDEDVARLQKTLLETRREAEALSLALENPGNQSRWRLLEGKIPDKEELTAKLQQLEERLAGRKEALLEKELILEEVTALSDKLRAQATEGREDTLELAKKVNEYQLRLRGATRKIMATVSELSMYQATALKLGAEREELVSAVQTAKSREKEGLPPTDDAEYEWQRMQREQDTLLYLAQQRAEEQAAMQAQSTGIGSTADARPNAYIPEDIGIPKPYGAFTPFKPSETGSTIRHVRKPQPKEIVI